MTEPFCKNCKHFVGVRDPQEVGSCLLGGPTPGDGCSDVGGDEWCEKYGRVGPHAMTPEEARGILEEAQRLGVYQIVCVCEPKRADIHACPIDPDKGTFTEFLMRLPR